MNSNPDSIDAGTPREGSNSAAADTAERRRVERVRVDAPASVETPLHEASVRLLEVSAQGARIQVEPGVEFEGDVVALTIPFTRDPAEAERLIARVVRRNGCILGLQWAEALPFDVRFKITRLMERERGTPTVLIGALPMLLWPSARLRER